MAMVLGVGDESRDSFIHSFEQKLKDVRVKAHTIGFLQAFSRFVALCNLTWATVVLLGAFVSDLLPRDFTFVVCLLLLEAARLASASFFVYLLTRPLAYHSQDPRNIDHGKDGHYPRSRSARISSYMMQFTLTVPSWVLSTIGVFRVLDHYRSHGVPNLQNSLGIFYSLGALNSLVAILTLICSARAFYSLSKSPSHDKPPEQSILRYFDTVLKNSTSSGLVQADHFEFFHFAYTMLGGEFSRIVQPEAVGKNHRQLIKYMYVHRLGVDFLQIYMDAGDAFVQLAAVNMVGFWADTVWGVGVGPKMLKLPRQVLVKLADKAECTGQVGWAAITSVGVLGCTPQWAEKLACTRNSSRENLLDRLVDIIDDSTNSSLSIVRTLAQLYEQLCVNKKRPPKPFTDAGTTLVPKLRKLAENARVQRLRVQAAYLLLLMGELNCTDQESSIIVANIKPTQDFYWFKSEVEMLDLLLQKQEAPAFTWPLDFGIRMDRSIDPPLWAQPISCTTP